MSHFKRTIFYLVDGARPDVISQLIDDGQLPAIKALISNGGSYNVATTCFPSTTGPAYLPFLTGLFPGSHGITGIRWFDKAEFFKGRYRRNAMRSYCGYEAKYFNDDMLEDRKTLLESFDASYNIYNMITRGVSDARDLTKKRKTKLYFNAHFKHIHHAVDEYGREELLRTVQSKAFDFIFAVFPSVDWDSHTYHYKDPKTINAYKIVDNSLAEVRDALKKQDMLHDTQIILLSDHGLTSTENHLDLAKYFSQRKVRALQYPTIWTFSPHVSVMISGNSFASLCFLKNGRDMLRTDDLAKDTTAVMTDLIREEAIDFMAYRSTQANSIRIHNNDGKALVRKVQSGYHYIRESGDPFRLDTDLRGLNVMEALEATIDSEYPDALVQVEQLFRSDRSGDIVVSARNNHDFRDFWEIPEHKGSHGSLRKEHMLVPLITNHKQWNTSWPLRTSDVYYSVLASMGKKVPAAIDGRPLNTDSNVAAKIN